MLLAYSLKQLIFHCKQLCHALGYLFKIYFRHTELTFAVILLFCFAFDQPHNESIEIITVVITICPIEKSRCDHSSI